MKNLNHILRTLVAALIIAPLAMSAANAAILYGTTGMGNDASSTLVTIDTANGAMTTIGTVGYVVNGLTWDVTTSTLYGSARNGRGLLKIDTATGAGSLVADRFNSNLGGCSGVNVMLTANSRGELFGWCDPDEDDLMSIDKVTGLARIVGDSGIGTAGHGLAFDNNDTLYLYAGDYYAIDTAAGGASYLGSFAPTGHHGDFHPETNLYYGLDFSGRINIIGLAGGEGVIGSLATSGLHTLAFADEAVAQAPEPASLALLGLGLAGLVAARRRKAIKA